MTLIDASNVTIGHLGIVAGVFDTLEIGKYIDEVIPKTRHHNITHGIGVKPDFPKIKHLNGEHQG